MNRPRIVSAFGRAVIACGALGLCFALGSCASAPSAPAASPAGPAAERPVPGPDEYLGTGRESDLQQAMNAAKSAALRDAVIGLIGREAAARKAADLDRQVFNPAVIDSWIVPGSLRRLASSNRGTVGQPDWRVELSLAVNRTALQAALAGLDTPAPATVAAAVRPKPADPLPAGPTEAQRAFIRNYMDKLSYLVHYNEKNPDIDPFALQSAVAMANSWLTGQGCDVAKPAQVEKLKRDRQMAREEQSGEPDSVMQWLSQSLNADLYLEIDARISRDSRSGNHYAQATVTVQIYETSTGQLLGSTPAMPGPQRMSSIDQTDADAKSVQDAVFNLMPRVFGQSRALLEKQYAKGVKYQVAILNPSDPDLIADFRNQLKRQANIADVVTRAESDKEALLDVYMYGRVDDLGDAVRAVRAAVPGLEKLRQIQKRGKTLSYDSGR